MRQSILRLKLAKPRRETIPHRKAMMLNPQLPQRPSTLRPMQERYRLWQRETRDLQLMVSRKTMRMVMARLWEMLHLWTRELSQWIRETMPTVSLMQIYLIPTMSIQQSEGLRWFSKRKPIRSRNRLRRRVTTSSETLRRERVSQARPKVNLQRSLSLTGWP